jgi:hypothetical protein
MQAPSVKGSSGNINYYILAAMFAGILIFAFANAYEPQIDSQADFFEISLAASQIVAGSFGLLVAKRYWGSRIFGRAYLALGVGFILWGIGSQLYTQMTISGVPLPYPGPPDFFFVPYFLLLTFHLTTCVHFFRKKLYQRDKLVIILLPLVVNIVYVFALLTSVSIPGSVPDQLSQQVNIDGQTFKVLPADDPSVQDDYQRVTIGNDTYALVPIELASTSYPQVPETNSSIDLLPLAFSRLTLESMSQQYDAEFWPPFLAGLFYNGVTTINLSLAIVGATVFRNSVLGVAWGLLLLGIALNAVGDIIYDFTTIYSYDRTNPAIDFWVFGSMIVTYALYLHRKNI